MHSESKGALQQLEEAKQKMGMLIQEMEDEPQLFEEAMRYLSTGSIGFKKSSKKPAAKASGKPLKSPLKPPKSPQKAKKLER